MRNVLYKSEMRLYSQLHPTLILISGLTIVEAGSRQECYDSIAAKSPFFEEKGSFMKLLEPPQTKELADEICVNRTTQKAYGREIGRVHGVMETPSNLADKTVCDRDSELAWTWGILNNNKYDDAIAFFCRNRIEILQYAQCINQSRDRYELCRQVGIRQVDQEYIKTLKDLGEKAYSYGRTTSRQSRARIIQCKYVAVDYDCLILGIIECAKDFEVHTAYSNTYDDNDEARDLYKEYMRRIYGRECRDYLSGGFSVKSSIFTLFVVVILGLYLY